MLKNISARPQLHSLWLIASIFCANFSTATADASSELQHLVQQDPKLQITWNDTQTQANYLSGRLSPIQYKSTQQLVAAFIQKNRSLLGLESASSLVLKQSAVIPNGQLLSYQQMYNGLEVVGGKLVARLQHSQLRTIANQLVTDLNISPLPQVEKTTAIQLATQTLKIANLKPEKIDLVYLNWEETTHLAWRLRFPPQTHPSAQYQVWVDAHSGEVILTENRMSGFAKPQPNFQVESAKAFKPSTLPAFFSLKADLSPLTDSDSETVELVIGEGQGLDGKLRKFKTTRNSEGVYVLRSHQGKNPKLKYATYDFARGNYRLFRDADNVWQDPSAVDAYTKAITTLNLYRQLGLMDSWYADSGFALVDGVLSVVHYQEEIGKGVDNAFWSGQAMLYGDGDEFFSPLAGSFDVVAHELTHAVSEATTNLIYCNEPGAINESWSDVMSMLFSLKKGDAHPYLLAETVMKIKNTAGKEGYYALRRMDDPSFRSDEYTYNDYKLETALTGWGQPAHTNEQLRVRRCMAENDMGGVHINSGILNRAAYLISQDLGAEVTANLYYQALFYLSSTANFKEVRAALKQVAVDLYGADSIAVMSVKQAFNTVGVR